MSEMSERRRNQVHRHPDFSSNEITAWRFHINRRYIENAVQERIIVRKKKKPRINIHKSFESYWFRLFRDEPASFAAGFKEISDITIEADAGMRRTIKNWNINDTVRGKVYELADAMAWFNQKGINIQNCKVADIRDGIKRNMELDFLK